MFLIFMHIQISHHNKHHNKHHITYDITFKMIFKMMAILRYVRTIAKVYIVYINHRYKEY